MLNYAKLFRVYEYIQPYLKYSTPLEDKLPLEKALVMSPHPDDEAIGCGGTVIKHLDGGGSVKMVFLTMDNEERRGEAKKSLEMLNVRDYEFFDFPMEDIDFYKCQEKLSKTIANYKPEIVFIPFMLDNHNDHRVANEVLISATKGKKYDFMIYSYPVWFPVFPNVLIDIGDVWEKKKKLIENYKSQIATRDYVTMSGSLARYWAVVKGRNLKYVETFFRASMTEYSDLWRKIYKK